ncbi:unnamed protein product [Adineta ricciae]|uniref:Mutator-like transposase domain-containing protein n=1 Tax=Adineta ricciae TaxID=249248 RepID=A0A816DIU2_ADIRI|nr:unnamed protein product [Adineta ricciae]
MPSKRKFSRQRTSTLLRHHVHDALKENIPPFDGLSSIEPSFSSNDVTPRSVLTLKRHSTTRSPSPIHAKALSIDTSSSRLSRADQASTSMTFSTPSFSRLSLSSNQTPSFTRFSSDSHRGASLEKLQTVSVSVEDEAPFDFYQMVHIQSLLNVVKQMICPSCHEMWHGNMSVKKREGLFASIEFMCQCSHIINMSTSPQAPNSRHREINLRATTGALLSGIGHSGLCKLLSALNSPPPVDEDNFTETLRHIEPILSSFKVAAMSSAVEEAVTKQGTRDLTVSGDGSWQKRGFSSTHGVVAVISSNCGAKVLDIERLSKRCTICQGALSIKLKNPEKYQMIMTQHECQTNFSGASGSMEVNGLHAIFKRSVERHNVRYAKYIGDGDAKVVPRLTEDPPYSDLQIQKLEDLNHFAKKMYNRLDKRKKELKGQVIEGRKGIGGLGRITEAVMVKLKWYYCTAITSNKTDLEMMYQAAWAIFKHKISTNSDPHHEWCDPKFCGYIKAKLTRQPYDHTRHAISPAIMEAIKPVFEELCSREVLTRALNGASQNSNEAFHSVLWTFAPKNRYTSGTIMDACVSIAVVVFNEGYLSLGPFFRQLCGSVGVYTSFGLNRLDQGRIQRERLKLRRKEERQQQGMKPPEVEEEETDDYRAGEY